MNLESLSSLQAAGFEGFATINSLQDTQCAIVPLERGVYLVLRTRTSPPQFLERNHAGWYWYPVADLERWWVPNAIVLNIGKAGGDGKQATLRTRLHDYMDFGLGLKDRHQGGRAIWQLADWASLLVCWKRTLEENPADVEGRYQAAFEERHGSLPFANRIRTAG